MKIPKGTKINKLYPYTNSSSTPDLSWQNLLLSLACYCSLSQLFCKQQMARYCKSSGASDSIKNDTAIFTLSRSTYMTASPFFKLWFFQNLYFGHLCAYTDQLQDLFDRDCGFESGFHWMLNNTNKIRESFFPALSEEDHRWQLNMYKWLSFCI